MTPDQRQARNKAVSGLKDEAKAVLTPERFAELEQKIDSSYIQASALATRLQLPATAAADIVAVQKDIGKRAQAVYGDKTLTPEQRTAQLNALGSEAVLRLSTTLGETGLAAYRQSGGGWLNQLQKPPTPSPTPKP